MNFTSAAAFLKHPRTPTSTPGMDYQTADSEHLMKRLRTGQSDEVSKKLMLLQDTHNSFFVITWVKYEVNMFGLSCHNNKIASSLGVILWIKSST